MPGADVAAIARQALASRRGLTGVSLDATRALASYAVQAGTFCETLELVCRTNRDGAITAASLLTELERLNLIERT